MSSLSLEGNIVRVRCSLGVYRVYMRPEDHSIGDIKTQLLLQHRIDCRNGDLWKEATCLHDKHFIAEYNIQHGDILDIKGVAMKVLATGTDSKLDNSIVPTPTSTSINPPLANSHALGGNDNSASCSEDVYIMHEMQESSLCGQHCLNNLLQESMFDTIALAEIAQEFNRAEMECNSDYSPENVDASGNFGISVLAAALQRSFGVELVAWLQPDDVTSSVVTLAFVIHSSQRQHWFVVRRIGSYWWNLDSLLDCPELISTSAAVPECYLLGLKLRGHTIFRAEGPVPVGGLRNYNPNDNPNTIWYLQEELVAKQASLYSADAQTDDNFIDRETEDDDIARAIKASLMDQQR